MPLNFPWRSHGDPIRITTKIHPGPAHHRGLILHLPGEWLLTRPPEGRGGEERIWWDFYGDFLMGISWNFYDIDGNFMEFLILMILMVLYWLLWWDIFDGCVLIITNFDGDISWWSEDWMGSDDRMMIWYAFHGDWSRLHHGYMGIMG